MSPAYPLSRSLPYILGALEALADVAIVASVTVGLTAATAAILLDYQKRSNLNQYMKGVDQTANDASTKVSAATKAEASEAVGNIYTIKRELQDLERGLEYNPTELGRQYWNKVKGLINKLESLSAKFNSRIAEINRNPSGSSAASKPTQYLDTGKPSQPPDEAIRQMAKDTIRESISGTSNKPRRGGTTSNSPVGLPPSMTTDERLPGSIPKPGSKPQTPNYKPSGIVPDAWATAPTVPNSEWAKPRPNSGITDVHGNPSPNPTVVQRGRSNKPRTQTNQSQAATATASQPRCEPDDPLSKLLREMIEEGFQEITQQTADQIEKQVEEARKEVNDALEAREKAKRKDPNFDSDKPDLRKTLERSLNQKFDDLPESVKNDLKKYYQFHHQNKNELGKPKRWTVQVINGRGKDPTIPKLRIGEDGRILTSKVKINTRAEVSQSYKLSKNFAETHGAGLSVIKELGLQRTIEYNHNIPVNVYQSNPLTKEIQRRIKSGDPKIKIQGADDGRGLTVMFRNPDAQKKFYSSLEKMKRTDPAKYKLVSAQLQTLRDKGVLLENIYHNGSHGKYDEVVKLRLDFETRELLKKFKTRDLKKIPSEDLNRVYEKVTIELREELEKADRNPRNTDFIDSEYCKPGRNGYNRLSERGKSTNELIASAQKLLDGMMAKISNPEELIPTQSSAIAKQEQSKDRGGYSI
jgi:hypothetical protein